MSTESGAVTALLERIRQGSAGAKNELITLLYDRFRQRAHRRLQHERPGHSLATTDLANEALLRLLKNDEFAKATTSHQLFRAFARAMRQVLIDHERRRNADKRGGGRPREELDDLVDDVRWRSQVEVISLHEALDALAAGYPEEAEVLQMHFFGGYTMEEIAEALSVSLSTVERASRLGKAEVHRFLSPGEAS
jgi:RNA polymerase sigma factor (TIGR02999 family)